MNLWTKLPFGIILQSISKVHYLTLSESEKRDKITKYYLDMKSRNITGKMYIFLFFIFFFILKMEPKLSECLVLRDFLSDVNKDANEWILSHCYYCKNCSACAINSRLQKELKRNHFTTKNKHIKWWKIYFVDALPVLKPIRLTTLIFLNICFWCLYESRITR